MLEGKFCEDFIKSVGTEVEKLACNHKHNGKIDVSPLRVRCNSCCKEFYIIDGTLDQTILNACDVVNSIVQTIKLLGDEKENKELCQFEFTLHKLLELYVKAKSEFDARVKKHNDDSFPHAETASGNPMNSFGTTKEEK